MKLKKYWYFSIVILIIIFVDLILCDSQSVDLDSFMKKEHPDFEDDTGLAPVNGDRNQEKNDNSNESNESEEAEDLWTRLVSGKNLDFTHAFVAALAVIIISELGDKTFFIAAIMAMTNPRITVFLGAMSALAFMHILAALFGYVFTYIPRVYTFYASAALFVFFGLKMLREGCKMRPNEGQEEMEEIQMDLRKREDGEDKDRDGISIASINVEEGVSPQSRSSRTLNRRQFNLKNIFPKVFLEAFVLSFLAEWGDRSQITTVILATSNDVYGIIVGGFLGHFICTALAVVGGKLIASKISVRTVTIIGGILFLVFAAVGFIMGPGEG